MDGVIIGIFSVLWLFLLGDGLVITIIGQVIDFNTNNFIDFLTDYCNRHQYLNPNSHTDSDCHYYDSTKAAQPVQAKVPQIATHGSEQQIVLASSLVSSY